MQSSGQLSFSYLAKKTKSVHYKCQNNIPHYIEVSDWMPPSYKNQNTQKQLLDFSLTQHPTECEILERIDTTKDIN